MNLTRIESLLHFHIERWGNDNTRQSIHDFQEGGIEIQDDLDVGNILPDRIDEHSQIELLTRKQRRLRGIEKQKGALLAVGPAGVGVPLFPVESR